MEKQNSLPKTNGWISKMNQNDGPWKAKPTPFKRWQFLVSSRYGANVQTYDNRPPRLQRRFHVAKRLENFSNQKTCLWIPRKLQLIPIRSGLFCGGGRLLLIKLFGPPKNRMFSSHDSCTFPPIIMVQWEMAPFNISFLSFSVIFHFHFFWGKG